MSKTRSCTLPPTAIERISRALRREGGSSITEAMVALGVIWFAILGLTSTIVIASADVGLGRQRQTATGIANELLEQVRGLPYNEIRFGMNSASTEFTSDTNIVTCGSNRYFGACPAVDPTAERIVSAGFPIPATTANRGLLHPLRPHDTVAPEGFRAGAVARLQCGGLSCRLVPRAAAS